MSDRKEIERLTDTKIRKQEGYTYCLYEVRLIAPPLWIEDYTRFRDAMLAAADPIGNFGGTVTDQGDGIFLVKVYTD